jgi:hypothetical protein
VLTSSSVNNARGAAPSGSHQSMGALFTARYGLGPARSPIGSLGTKAAGASGCRAGTASRSPIGSRLMKRPNRGL